MWPRLLEVGLAAWLAAAPFVLGAGRDAARVAHDVGVALVIAVFALASLTRRFRYAHLLTLAVALWLTAYGWWRFDVAPHAIAQNHMLLGLTLLMTAILPSEAARPPAAWRRAWGEPGA
jgi:hypothetical protein